jgi:single-strand DNA-binding protein
MASKNLVFLIGNLGHDPEVSQTTGGTSVAKLNVATTEKYKDRSGNQKEITTWHIVRVWQQAADFIGKYAKKGTQVYVEGKLRTETWERDGQRHSQQIVEASDIQILDRRPEGRDDSRSRQQRGSGNGYGQYKSRSDYDRANSLEPQPDDMPF